MFARWALARMLRELGAGLLISAIALEPLVDLQQSLGLALSVLSMCTCKLECANVCKAIP